MNEKNRAKAVETVKRLERLPKDGQAFVNGFAEGYAAALAAKNERAEREVKE